MNSRERIAAALEHKKTDRVPVDFGGTTVTGISASTVFKLRQALGLKERPIKIINIMQMLGEIDDELRKLLGTDTISPLPLSNFYGTENKDWKEWRLFDGTPVLVPGDFNTTPDSFGNIYQYPQGNTGLPPSAIMPKGGYYFDAISRQGSIDDDNLDPNDNIEEYKLYTDEFFRIIEREIDFLYNATDYAIIGSPGQCALGDVARITAPQLKNPKGIRDVEEWYVSILTRKEYIKEVFDKQTDIALINLKKYKEAVGNKISVVNLCGADFGSQNAPLISPELFYELYYPYYKKITDWIHENTSWKTFKHSCGSIVELIGPLADAGFDILNPVQCSAKNMNPSDLKSRFGNILTFWGGGVDTQKTLPYGTVEEVKQEVNERIRIFYKNGGFVFSSIHNIQADAPVENILCMIDAVNSYSQ